MDGDGVPKDVAAMAKWYRRSAEQGYAAGMASLAKAYSFGLGVPRDSVEAFVWYSLAVDRLPAGQRQRDAMASRDLMASRISPEELNAARERIKAWKQQ
jgi:TPR repeat protein